MNFTIGQKLYYVPTNRYRRVEPAEVTVTAVGRKWVTIKDGDLMGRFVVTDKRMQVDGGDYKSPGRCYLSREAYEAEQAINARWLALVRWMEAHRWEAPHGMTLERVEQAETLLKCYEVTP